MAQKAKPFYWTEDIKANFLGRVVPDVGECMTVHVIPERSGYIRLKFNNDKVLAHRLAWLIDNNVHDTPNGWPIEHSCGNRRCVNPAHLEALPQQQNILRGNTGDWETAKTHCPQGHPYEGDNLRLEVIGHVTKRHCRRCDADRTARASERRMAGTLEVVDRRGTTCKRGHMLDDESIYVNPDGSQECRLCRKERRRAAYLKSKK